MVKFDSSTPFILIARIQIKPDKVSEYLELATNTDAAVQASEPGMLHHTFDQDPENPLCFTWSEVYKDDEAFLSHLANPPVGAYLQGHAQLGDGFTVEVYGTVGDKCKTALEETGLPVKIFESKCGYSRL
ncbi:antibiotic biosynthesis monooxygenase family protein [Prochlorococcus sp. MIT 1300]|uniref:putative quinol monooxygenase n=1 Tax=Prochlorococcus sp. MIT 1300 TaxID=3096218 RepID=UPI002A7613F6|nr:antibiotic biosynthesis monooxygenase family protein [Prochlorococcus sp. MIT 1300]